ncbi:unnamed protein product [Rangifer tarandus platyrhynchus]|uniref:Uncharacterized protein n=2 Tax=Rangifer tarandus platyrhynchus TaxID=3082113 RepID=A0ABN8YTN1_RANTA|nr:unnamed protein product [Rangifer tarandus platyrhynchus]
MTLTMSQCAVEPGSESTAFRKQHLRPTRSAAHTGVHAFPLLGRNVVAKGQTSPSQAAGFLLWPSASRGQQPRSGSEVNSNQAPELTRSRSLDRASEGCWGRHGSWRVSADLLQRRRRRWRRQRAPRSSASEAEAGLGFQPEVSAPGFAHPASLPDTSSPGPVGRRDGI